MKQQLGAKRVAMAAALLLGLAWVGTPAQADSNNAATGALSFEGPVDLAAGTWNGTFTGTLSGSYGSSLHRTPWTIALINPANAGFSSVELLGCAAETATGQFRIKTNGYNQVFGAIEDSVIPTSIVAVDVTIDFVWHRAGSGGAMTVTGMVVDAQRYVEAGQTLESDAGWMRLVDSGATTAGVATARIEGGDPAACGSGILKGELTDLALR